MSQLVNGRIMNYRIGLRTQKSRECLIQFDNVASMAQAGKFIGQKIIWKSGKSRLIGRIIGIHGKKGVVIAKFKKGVPGQAIGTTVELISQLN